MSETQSKPRNQIADPFHDIQQQGAGADMMPTLMPRAGGQQTDAALAHFVTAQRVAVKRNLGSIMQEVQALGQASGADFYYRIPFKDRRSGDTTWVEGPSIDCAMAVAMAYGNCKVGATVSQETHEYWRFSAVFIDLEKGTTVTREFQQRKSQSSGMRDAGRQIDIIFQVGQSKAIRNVIVAALPTPTNLAYAAAKKSVLAKVEQDPQRFREWLGEQIEAMRFDPKRIERAMGTPLRAWSLSQLARVYADLKAVKDGVVQADELWPVDGAPPADAPVRSETAAANAVNNEGEHEPNAASSSPPPPPPPQRRAPRTSGPPREAPVAAPTPPPPPPPPPPLDDDMDSGADKGDDRLPLPPNSDDSGFQFGG
ncbi:MAG: hypothetical protein RIR25_488 [Verrucomicrobiota bacterium]